MNFDKQWQQNSRTPIKFKSRALYYV